LYTQCSHCETVFQLTAETLRAAGGQVRCGRCGEVFNALARLAEDAGAFALPGESSSGEGALRESALEMEARADEILGTPTPTRPEPTSEGEDFASSDVEFARLQLIEKFKPSRPEIPAPPRHIAPPVTTPPPAPRPATPKAASSAAESGKRATRDAAPAPPARARAPSAPAGAPDDRAGEGALEFTLPPGELDRVFVAPAAARPAGFTEADSKVLSPHPEDLARERFSGMDVDEEVQRDVVAGLRHGSAEESGEPADRTMRLAWGGAAAVMALILLGQVLHENRAWLAAHGPLRAELPGVYGALGMKVQPPANLSAYQLRQWGVTGDPSAAGTLRVRASILNTSAQLQPYPLLRVTLANRFGTHVGARDFEPAEYLGRPVARLMTPGERADATLDIQDPGKDAEGFEIDVCLRGPDQAVACAADAAPQAGQPQAKP
jgi:predicted Zn finger-like uncharacterized protein